MKILNHAWIKCQPNLNDGFKSFSSLTTNNRHIRLTPGGKRNIKEFIQWSSNIISNVQYPAMIIFPVQKSTGLIHRSKFHKAFEDKSKIMVDTEKTKLVHREVQIRRLEDNVSRFSAIHSRQK